MQTPTGPVSSPIGRRARASSAAIPLGAFAALIPDDVRSDDPLELIRRSTERIRTRAGGRPVCPGVDDAHLLDPASAALVLHLATAAGVFIIATIRAGVTAPDAIDSLWKDGGARRIELRPLERRRPRGAGGGGARRARSTSRWYGASSTPARATCCTRAS